VSRILYPQPILGRGSSSGTYSGVAAPPGATVPRVRLWSFECWSANSDPHCVVSDRFQGFGVITDLEYQIVSSQGGGGLHVYFAFGSSASGARNGGSDVTMPEGTPIYDSRKFSDVNDVNAESLPMRALVGAQAYGNPWSLPVRVPVSNPEFFLKLYFRGIGGAAAGIQGHARVIEGLSEDEVPNFL
jgi:hypothetical protein